MTVAGKEQIDYVRTFNRYELKYLMHYKQARELFAAIGPHVRADPHRGLEGFYKVVSRYYDSNDLRFFWEKLDGEKYRRKVRVRTYGPRPDKAFVEIKQRTNLSVQKRRCVASLDLVEREMARICSGRYRQGLDPVFDEVFILSRAYALEPKLIVSYQRAAFFDLHKRDLRITLDRNIKCRNISLDLAEHRMAGRYMIPPTWVLLEVKFNEVIPRWLCTTLNRFNLQIDRVSKYCRGVERCGMHLRTRD